VLLPSGLALKLDHQDVGRAGFVRCLPNGCVAQVVMDDKLLNQLRTAKTATFIIFETPKRGHRLPAQPEPARQRVRQAAVRGGLSEQLSHADYVFIQTIDLNGVALETLNHKADFPVEFDGARVVLPNRQFHPVKSDGSGRGERRSDQIRANPLPPEPRQQTYPENATMGINRPFLGRDITPTDHFARRYCDKLGMAALDMVEHERPRALQRRPLNERQISPLPRNKIEGPVKAIDMILCYRNNFDRAHRSANAFDSAPRGMTAKQLSWMQFSDNGLFS
jgi:hypothetical protein